MIKENSLGKSTLTLSQTSPGLKCLKFKSLKVLVTSNFSFSHSIFYRFGELSAIFIKFEIVVCKHFDSGRV